MAEKFNYGGQALIEGVMMRGSKIVAIAVRDPEGSIIIQEKPISKALYDSPLSRTPFVRGLGMLWDSLGLGMSALTFSANVATGEEEDLEGPAVWGMLALSLAILVAVFFLMPAAAADGLHRLSGLVSPLLGNVIEGIIRLVLIIGYIWVVGYLEDIRRVYAYHGAEHKTINAFEDGAPLTPEAVAAYSVEHPRCGTAFLLTVAVISLLIFSVLGRPPLWIRLLSRVALLPVIAGVSYEIIRFTARHMDNPIVRAIAQPNLALQRLTTREPDASMLEVAIAALQRVLASEGLS
jgi:uncharacterized protein YqhQ